MAASLSDMFQISQDTTFQGRVQASLLAACVAIANEGWAVAFHRERSIFAGTILSATQTPNPYYVLFSNAVATDPTCAADASTQAAGPLTTANRAAACAAITDAHINAAVSAQFNAFCREPAN